MADWLAGLRISSIKEARGHKQYVVFHFRARTTGDSWLAIYAQICSSALIFNHCETRRLAETSKVAIPADSVRHHAYPLGFATPLRVEMRVFTIFAFGYSQGFSINDSSLTGSVLRAGLLHGVSAGLLRHLYFMSFVCFIEFVSFVYVLVFVYCLLNLLFVCVLVFVYCL